MKLSKGASRITIYANGKMEMELAKAKSEDDLVPASAMRVAMCAVMLATPELANAVEAHMMKPKAK